MTLKTDTLNLTAGDRDNFSTQLMLLYQKADMVNSAKIRRCWPNLVTVFEAWYTGPMVPHGLTGPALEAATAHIPDLPYDGPEST